MGANPSLTIPQANFINMPQKFRGYVGGFGCVQGDTLIATEHGLIKAREITQPMRVLSWSEKNNRFELSLSGGAYAKGKARLYRVSTSQGEFVASGHHRVLCAQNNYQRVDALCVGDKVQSSCPIQHQTSLALVPLSLHANDESLNQRLASSMGDYANAARLYGQQLLQEVNSDLAYSPLLSGAQELNRPCVRLDGQSEHVQTHNHHYQQNDRQCKNGLVRQFEHHDLSGQRYVSLGRFAHALLNSSVAQRFEQMKKRLALNTQVSLQLVYSQISQAFYAALGQYRNVQYSHKPKCDYSQFYQQAVLPLNQVEQDCKSSSLSQSLYSSSIKAIDVISITQMDTEEVFYDMQVLDNNNYVSADGVIHHNSGKTWAGCGDTCKHHYENPRITTGYFAPTYPQIRDIFYPTIEECAYDWGLRVEIKESNKEVHFYSGKQYRGTTICRSMDNPSSIVGFKIGHALVDEIDVMHTEKARQAWRKIIARMRYKVDGLKNGIAVTTTPEGFKFTYEQFVKEANSSPAKAKLYGLIQASTYDNEINLPDDYIESLRESYPKQLIEAYLNGQFVNLASGAVYPEFDRRLNHTDAILQDGEVLHVGMDFNVLKMAAALFVIRNGLPIAVGEHTEVRDTPTMAKLLIEKYAANHKIVVYPDASGHNTSSKDSNESDHTILRQAGLTVYVDNVNPAIKSRLNAVNGMILNSKGERRFLVNTHLCPDMTDGLEQQIYDKHGMPDKTAGVDHLCFSGDTLVTTKQGLFRFREIPESGYVLSPYGKWTKYQKARKTGNKVTVSITVANGYMVQCTLDHKLLTTEGWVCAKDVIGKVLVLSVKQRRSSMVLDTTCAEATSRTAINQKRGFTGLFGFTTMGLSKMVVTYTTLTTMSQTIKLKILRALVANTTCDITGSTGLLSSCTQCEKKVVKQLKSGTQAKQALSGIKSSISELKTCYKRQKMRFAQTATKIIKRQYPITGRKISFAQRAVRQLGAESQVLMTNLGFANFVARDLELTNIKRNSIAQHIVESPQENIGLLSKVVSVEVVGFDDVYCLEVPEFGCFKLSSESPVVSNCDAVGYFINHKYPVIKSPTSTNIIMGY